MLPVAPFLYPILDLERLRGRDVGQAVEVLAAAGAPLIQVRGKRLGDRALVEAVKQARAAARTGAVLLVVNDRADVAHIVDADGVHVGQDDLPPWAVRAVVGPGRLVGVSTHSLEQLGRAAAEPVDYVALGPVFQTHSKERPDAVVGLDLLRHARETTRLPLVAIGGITRANARAVIEAGADGVAMIADLLDAPDLGAAAREMIAVLASARRP